MKTAVKFLPLLGLYLLLIFLFQSNDFYARYGDQERYVKYADNLLNGFYTKADNVDLTNGPGYPLTLLPFRLLDLPLIYSKIFNAFLYFFSLIYLFKLLRIYLDENKSLRYSYLYGLYPPLVILIPVIYTEVLSAFILTAFAYHLTSAIHNKKNFYLHFFLSAFLLAFIALTRTIFGYVILTSLVFFLFLYIFKKSYETRRIVLVLVTSLLFCLPYLVYTYSLTGKIFYWATNGGEVLYWMTSPSNEEYGDWFSNYSVENINGLRKNHLDFYTKLEGLSQLEKDAIFKEEALKNIQNYPVKYFKNWIANIGRLVFNFPISYGTNRLTTYFYVLPNMVLLSLIVFCLYPGLKFRKHIPVEIKLFHVIIFVYLGGSSLVSANPRYFAIIVPILILGISYIFSHFVKIEFFNKAEFNK